MNKIEELMTSFCKETGTSLIGLHINENGTVYYDHKYVEWLQDKVNSAVEEQKVVLKKYEEWEAKLIMEDNCWENGLPELTQELFEEFLEIQELRNQAIREQ